MNYASTAKDPIHRALLRRRIRLEQTKRGKKGGAFTRHHNFLAHGDPECPEIRQPAILTAHQIKALRANLDLKAPEFAAKLGVHPDTVKKYEAGSRIPSFATLRVMQLLQINPGFSHALPAGLHFNQDKIYLIRSNLNVSQSVFARILGVETSTLRGWEISKRKPSGPSASLLSLAYSYPSEFVSAIIQEKAQEINFDERIKDVSMTTIEEEAPSPPPREAPRRHKKNPSNQTTFNF